MEIVICILVPAIPREHIGFIRRISSDHLEYGEDRIALELEIKFGIRHSPTTIPA